jgi:hypothetical protein
MASLAMNKASPMETVLKIIRVEGENDNPSASHEIGFKYAISVLGTFEDYKKDTIKIRRKWRGGEEVTFPEMRHYQHIAGTGYTDTEAYKIFSRRLKREYVIKEGEVTPSGYVNAKWEAFKLGSGGKFQMPKFAGGPVTYSELVSEGKTEAEMELLFNKCRRKHIEREEGGLGCAIYNEFQKLIANWDYSKYLGETVCQKFSADLERHSAQQHRPLARTSFCTLVGRMMHLVQLNHRNILAKKHHMAATERKAQKKIANDKRCTKYNTMKEKIGTEEFNAMKARDQAAKETKAAVKVAAQSDTVSQFLQWRTKTAPGLGFDNAPVASYVRMFLGDKFAKSSHNTHLGYTNREILAKFVKYCLINRCAKGFSNMLITFKPDATRAETQLYQYAAIKGRGPLQLGKTRDVDCANIFKITGVFEPNISLPWGVPRTNFYVNLDSKVGSVYYSLPQKWKAFEQWSGFGVKGNPKCSTSMKTLFKIVDSNIENFSFVKDDNKYSVGFTTNVRALKNVAELLHGVKSKYDTAAAAAALMAEEQKRQRAQSARAAERAKAMRKKNETPRSTRWCSKAMLAQQLAEGKIDMETFKMAMSALD